MVTVLTIKERIEYSQKQKEIKKIWNDHKNKTAPLTETEIAALKIKAEQYRLQLH